MASDKAWHAIGGALAAGVSALIVAACSLVGIADASLAWLAGLNTAVIMAIGNEVRDWLRTRSELRAGVLWPSSTPDPIDALATVLGSLPVVALAWGLAQ